VTAWPSTRASRILAALLKIGWAIKRQSVPTARFRERGGQTSPLLFTITRSWVRRCSLALPRARASSQRTCEGVSLPANKRMQLTKRRCDDGRFWSFAADPRCSTDREDPSEQALLLG
jgi:hypothetical protein